jgi:hypothetical protein
MKKNKDREKPHGGSLLPAEKASVPVAQGNGTVDEAALFERVAAIIESRKSRAAAYANGEVTLMYWEVGQQINATILDFKRAAYGKKILTELASKLTTRYGNSFSERNLYRIDYFIEPKDDEDE